MEFDQAAAKFKLFDKKMCRGSVKITEKVRFSLEANYVRKIRSSKSVCGCRVPDTVNILTVMTS
jgi:hypothetical protein